MALQEPDDEKVAQRCMAFREPEDQRRLSAGRAMAFQEPEEKTNGMARHGLSRT